MTGRRQPPQVGDVLTWRQQTDQRGRPQAAVLATIVAGLVYWKQARTVSDGPPAAVQMSADSPLRTPVAAAPRFTCAGKTRCGQMRSCDEAKFYLKHCPGTITDGDGDGIPCEH